MGEVRIAYKISIGKPEGVRPLRRPRHTWEEKKVDLREEVLEGMDWIHPAWDRDCW
jgi:hypothetical protein